MVGTRKILNQSFVIRVAQFLTVVIQILYPISLLNTIPIVLAVEILRPTGKGTLLPPS